MIAYNSDTLDKLWTFNVGTTIAAPPSVFAVDGKEYVGIVAGGSGTGLWQPAAMIYVFGLDW
jgi:hypothetical protein